MPYSRSDASVTFLVEREGSRLCTRGPLPLPLFGLKTTEPLRMELGFIKLDTIKLLLEATCNSTLAEENSKIIGPCIRI